MLVGFDSPFKNVAIGMRVWGWEHEGLGLRAAAQRPIRPALVVRLPVRFCKPTRHDFAGFNYFPVPAGAGVERAHWLEVKEPADPAVRSGK